MGKGLIISGGTDGQYQVQLMLDRWRLTAELARLASMITQTETLIGTLTIDVSNCNIAIGACNAAIANDTAAVQAALAALAAIPHTEPPGPAELAARAALDQARQWLAADQRTLTETMGDLEKVQRRRRLATLEAAGYRKRKEYIEGHQGSDPTVSAWCADLTEDLSGLVGTIEVPGERAGGVNIYPGYGGAAAFDAAADGQIQGALAGTPAGTFYNLALLPGWQKWRPTYRYATITALDGDHCDVTLEAAASSQQALDVNQGTTLAGVEIDYMD
jgi:hypothetical protein